MEEAAAFGAWGESGVVRGRPEKRAMGVFPFAGHGAMRHGVHAGPARGGSRARPVITRESTGRKRGPTFRGFSLARSSPRVHAEAPTRDGVGTAHAGESAPHALAWRERPRAFVRKGFA